MDFETKIKITPEKKKENEAKLKCKICGKSIVGKETLSRHISHAHDEIDEVRREKMVIDAYYGKSKVDKVIHDFENGKYPRISDLPIKIYRYINLAGIKKGGKVVKSKEDDVEDTKGGEFSSASSDTAEEERTLILVDANSEERSFVEDALYYEKEDKLVLVSTSNFDEALTLVQLREFLEDQGVETTKLFVKKDDVVSKISSIEIINVDNGGEDSDEDSLTGYSRCVVAYSPQQSDSEEDSEEDKSEQSN